MFRLILYLLLAVVVISVLQAIIRVIRTFFQALTNAASPQKPRPGADIPLAGELKRDPVCGTFIAASTSLKYAKGSEVTYFCSTGCRDKYLATAAHR